MSGRAAVAIISPNAVQKLNKYERAKMYMDERMMSDEQSHRKERIEDWFRVRR